MSEQLNMRNVLVFFMTLILGTIGGTAVIIAVADPNYKLPVGIAFALAILALGMMAIR